MARNNKPSGREIAEQAKKAKLESRSATTAEKDGKKVKVTPADLLHLNNEEEIEQGQVIGILESELDDPTTDLPPGQYNLFLAKIDDQWQVFAESGGVVVEGKKIAVEKLPPGRRPGKPKIEFGSIAVTIGVCVGKWGVTVCFSVTFEF